MSTQLKLTLQRNKNLAREIRARERNSGIDREFDFDEGADIGDAKAKEHKASKNLERSREGT